MGQSGVYCLLLEVIASINLPGYLLCENLQVHFVEMDPWVVSDVLRPNLEWTGFLDVSVIHTVRVENFFERAERFVGMCSSFCLLCLCIRSLF